MSSFDDSNPPNWKRLRAIHAEAEALIRTGRWTRAEYERLLAEAEDAVNGHDEFLEGFFMLEQRITD